MTLCIEVLEWRQEDSQEIVHRFEPGGEIKMGAQLTVTENQWAVFFRDGRAHDVFGTGRFTIGTNNIPLLVQVIKIPFGGTSPFRADVYFVSRKNFVDQKWGTRDPVVFRDKEFGMVRLRANGRYSMRVADPRKLVNTLVGTLGRYNTTDIEDYLREIIVQKLNDTLGERGLALLDLPRYYDELAEELKQRTAADFTPLGLELQALYLGAITPPEEVAKVIDERSAMAAVGMGGNYLGFKAARALGDAAAQPGGAGGAASEGLGLGVGAGVGMAIPGMIREALQGTAGNTPSPAAHTTAAFCKDCGGALPKEARFCPGCGKKIG